MILGPCRRETVPQVIPQWFNVQDEPNVSAAISTAGSQDDNGSLACFVHLLTNVILDRNVDHSALP